MCIRDRFDDRSFHFTASVDGELAAYCRTVSGPNAMFETWTRGAAKTPVGKEVIDLTRCCVSPKFRGLNLSILICLESLIHASTSDFERVIAAVVPGRRMGKRLNDIGFVDTGSPVQIVCPDGTVDQIQPSVAIISEWVESWKHFKESILVDNFST